MILMLATGAPGLRNSVTQARQHLINGRNGRRENGKENILR